MKKTILLLILGFFAMSCQEESSAEETNAPNEVNEKVPVVEPETEFQQTNVVTPEFWESFETDVRVVFFYSKKESSADLVHQVKEKVIEQEASLNYIFHEYHTDDNMGMVQVDDNVFFNLSEYLWNSDEGFVLLRKGAMLHVPASELPAEGLGSQVADFFTE